MRQLPRSVVRPSIVRSVVISRKLSKTDPSLVWNTNRKLAPLILLPHSEPPQTPPGLNKTYVQIVKLIRPRVRLGVRPQLLSTVVNRVRPSESIVNNYRPLS